jgi:superfamily II DNA helicase RecQ
MHPRKVRVFFISTMDDFQRRFMVYDQYRILVCIPCQFAVVPSQVREHLRAHHCRYSSQQRSDIINRVNSLTTLARTHADVVYPSPTSKPVDHLPVYHDGLRCLAEVKAGQPCEYVCRTVYGIQEHCKRAHSWTNKRKRGGDVRSSVPPVSNEIWEHGCACQCFFKFGSWQRYFQVAAGHGREKTESAERTQDTFFRKMEADLMQTEHDAKEDANRVQGFDEHRSAVLPWLRETGVVDHLAGLQKHEIKAATARPSPGEHESLERIVQVTDSILREAHSWCFDGPECMLTWPCRVILSRFQSPQSESLGKIRPFDPYKEPGTLKTYFGLACRALAYFDRVAAGSGYFFTVENEDVIRPEDVMEPTEEQLDTWKQVHALARSSILDDSDVHIDRLKAKLIDFWMLLVRHQTGSRRYKSPLLSFCAMLSIKPSTQSWLEPGNFNSHLSAIIWVVQLLLFFDSARKEKLGEGDTLAHVRQQSERCLQQTVETPMGEILRWRLLLFRVSKDTVGEHEALWDEEEQVLTYESVELHMDDIPKLLRSEYRDCQTLLYEDLMFGVKGIYHMSAWSLKDSAEVDTVGWSFVQHRDNAPLLKSADKVLLRAIEGSTRLCQLFLVSRPRSSDELRWRDSALAGYEATVQQFLRRLGVLVHVSGGQPVRESEFFSMTWRNTQRRRSISICHNRVMIHVRYHKGQQQTGRHKENVRFLAHPVGELLLDYIVYVMPLRQLFLRQHSPKALLPAFVWEKDGKVWADGQLSRCLEEASTRAGIPRLHVANWRQMTVAIVKTKFTSHLGLFEADDADEDAEEMEDDIRAMTKQRNHKTQTVNRAYANQTGAAFGNVWDGLIRMALRASTLWQDFWGVEIILKPTAPAEGDPESRLTKRIARGVYRPRKPWSSEALLAGLRQLYGNVKADWKSNEQREALAQIMSWTEQVVAILPTGAGKSLLFMLPCTLPGARVTVLVVPLVSLHGDMLRRLRELRIDHLEWQPGENREAALVLVSAEAVSTKAFMKYAQSLITQQKLDRIVVDECHLTVIAAEYRPSIVGLTLIRSLRTQFVYLTATLPPSMQTEFEDRNYLCHPTVIRASSNRPNLLYMVRKTDARRGTLLDQSAVEARQAWDESDLFDHARDKIILYVRTCQDADTLSGILGCSSYTAESGTPLEKKGILDRWVQSQDIPYIVATTALAEGFDYAHVRLVMNVDEPESLVIFAQESGRAGRDGRRAYSMVLLPATWEPQNIADSTISGPRTETCRDDASLAKRHEKHAVHRYLQGDQCYRTSLTEYLDPPALRRWCMSDDVPCDVCLVAHEYPIPPPKDTHRADEHTGLNLIQQERLRSHTELSQYRLDLASVKGTCLLCRAVKARWDHGFTSCPRRHDVFRERAQARQRHEGRGRRWLQPYTSCFWCLNPQSICQRAELGGQDAGTCEHPDIVLPLCFGVFESLGGDDWLRKHFGREFVTVQSYFDWLGEETRFGGDRAIQAVRVAATALRFL